MLVGTVAYSGAGRRRVSQRVLQDQEPRLGGSALLGVLRPLLQNGFFKMARVLAISVVPEARSVQCLQIIHAMSGSQLVH